MSGSKIHGSRKQFVLWSSGIQRNTGNNLLTLANFTTHFDKIALAEEKVFITVIVVLVTSLPVFKRDGDILLDRIWFWDQLLIKQSTSLSFAISLTQNPTEPRHRYKKVSMHNSPSLLPGMHRPCVSVTSALSPSIEVCIPVRSLRVIYFLSSNIGLIFGNRARSSVLAWGMKI